MSARRGSFLAGAGIVLGLLTVPALAVAAFAHDSLIGSDPSSGATVTALDEVTLTFSADPLGGDGATVLEVTGPDGRYYETGCPTLAGQDVTVPVALGAAGEYEVLWRIVSSDGHPVSDTFTFDYEPASTATSAAGADVPQCGDASAAQAATPGAAADDAAQDPGLWIGLGIGAVVVAGVGVGAWLLIRRRPEDG
ncbi:MAG: copper resistance protein CopC [Microbacterium sp.]|uniref:copper resistance CopC family protein n=1 Tax=Microbacterium sp. TaxID=51671 RepID=UPI0039E3DC12